MIGAFFGVLKNLAGFGIDADFLNNFSLLDVEGITQAAATLFGFKFFVAGRSPFCGYPGEQCAAIGTKSFWTELADKPIPSR